MAAAQLNNEIGREQDHCPGNRRNRAQLHAARRDPRDRARSGQRHLPAGRASELAARRAERRPAARASSKTSAAPTARSSVRSASSRQVLNAGEIVRIGPFELALQMRATPSPTSASEHTMFDMAAFRGVPPVVRRQDNEQTATQRTLRFTSLSESYRTANLRQEVIAGLTVAALVVPQGMAYALLAGLPPVDGPVRFHPADDRLCARRQRSANVRRSGDGGLADAGAGAQHAGDRRHRFVHRARCAGDGDDRRDSAGDGRAAPGLSRQLSFLSGAGRDSRPRPQSSPFSVS